MQIKRRKKKTRKVIGYIICIILVAATTSAVISINSAIKAAKEDGGILSYTSMVDDGVRVPVRVFGIIIGYVTIG